MRRLLLFTLCCFISFLTKAQSADIILELKQINDTVNSANCNNNNGKLISNKAFNLLTGYKIGYYLSNINDLSYYKNNIIINTTDGSVAVNHNVFEAKGEDEPIRSVLFFGVKANVGDVFVKSASNKKINNQFGINIKQTWIGRGKTSFNCNGVTNKVSGVGAKDIMSAERAVILHGIEDEINKKSLEFEAALDAVSTSATPVLNPDGVKAATRVKFYKSLKEEYAEKFASLQATALDETKVYNTISSSWTSINIYIPITTERFAVAENLTSLFEEKHAYNAALNINYTKFWENRKAGKIFLNAEANITLNNSQKSYALTKMSFSDYKNMGGIDTAHQSILDEDDVYIGSYKNFITPSLKAKLIYFPPDYHFGLSFLLEQNFGSYKALNSILGIPIVLIDKKGLPSLDMEFQVQFFNLNNTTYAANYLPAKTFIGLTVGIPFSKIIF